MEINWHGIGILMMGVAAGVLCICLIVSSGCVTAGKTAFKTLDDLSGTPYPTPTPTAQITKIPDPEINVSLNPVPVRIESTGEYLARTNGRYEGDLYNFVRVNASGYQNLMIYATVYGHKFMPVYNTWSDEWARYFTEHPQTGKKYLFVYVVVWVDTVLGDDCRPYGFDADHWRVQVKDSIYEPVSYYDPAWRIKEMETIPDYNHVGWIRPYGYLWRFDSVQGWVADPLGWIKGGKSNAWDGYLIYEVPDTARAEDVKVIGRFENLGGWAWWQLS